MKILKGKIISFIVILILCKLQAMTQSIYSDIKFNSLLRSNSGGWIAGDATYSIDLPDNRTLWLFGDSFIGTVNEDGSIVQGAKMIRNCALIMDNDSLRALYGGTFENPSEFIQTTMPDSTWYWPDHGIVENNILKIFLAKFTTDPNGTPGWNFVYAGHDVASFSFPEIQLIEINELPYYSENAVLYGDRLFRDSIYTYIYGRKDHTVSEYKIPYPHIARTTGDISNNWEFYNGSNWSDDPTATEPINNFQVSQQYCVFKHQNKYILITQDIWLSANIYSFTSNSPVGPWENKKILYTTPIVYDNTFTYNAYAHPQFDENNELLISYNTNGDFWEIFNNVEIYRPNFIRVPYELIDNDFAANLITIKKKDKLYSFELYPNPAQNEITLEFVAANNDNTEFTIYNTKGQIEKRINNNIVPGACTKTINISALPHGIYYCVLKNRENCVTKKLIKID
ncbi:MAG: DUF5005 domain-containing protein [Salinivirgaceae bacterium]|nr:DUF5005 domain-containing protein [Salinivirgaceae bacterium]